MTVAGSRILPWMYQTHVYVPYILFDTVFQVRISHTMSEHVSFMVYLMIYEIFKTWSEPMQLKTCFELYRGLKTKEIILFFF